MPDPRLQAAKQARELPLHLFLAVLTVLLLVAVALPLIWLGYDRGKDAAKVAAHEHMQLLADRTIDRYRVVFGNALPTVAMITAAEAFTRSPPADITAKMRIIRKALRSSAHTDGIYVGYPDGSFVHGVSLSNNETWRQVLNAPPQALFAMRVIEAQSDGTRRSTWNFLGGGGQIIGAGAPAATDYDPRVRPWYSQAVTTSGPTSVGPYVTATTKQLALTIAERHDVNPKIVAGVDVLLITIADFLRQEKISPHASAYVLDSEGNVIIRSGTGDADDEIVLAAAKKALLSNIEAKNTTAQFTIAGEPYVGGVSPVHLPPLVSRSMFVAVAPLRDFTQTSEELLEQGFRLSLILLIAGILLAIFAARQITRSLSRLTDKAASLGDLDVESSALPVSYIKEINSLARALTVAREAIGTFAIYVPRELVRRIVASSQRLAGAAIRQTVTVLFTDIRDFTTICEEHPPEEVVAMLSAYFELMNQGVERNHGAVIQFLGDSVYAMWNAPLDDARHVARGCHCALDLRVAIDEFNAGQRAVGRPEFVTRFGLHTGTAVVGSVGAIKRLQYTAMGDTVNVASRLEGINKEFGTTILVSGEVRSACAGEFIFRPLGLTQAKGRARRIELFELIGVARPVGEPADGADRLKQSA